MDAWRLQKLLYYTQAWHVAITDEALFPERIKAWKDGPVVPQVRYARRDQSSRRSSDQDLSGIDLDETTSDLIDLVLAKYGSMTGPELSALTHVEEPWKEARGDTPDGAECRSPISLESMASFYRANGMLGGRTAADMAAGGIHVRSREANGASVDIDAILGSLGSEYDLDEDDPWGGANLSLESDDELEGIEQAARRAYAGA